MMSGDESVCAVLYGVQAIGDPVAVVEVLF